jgi:hypothetical protein
VPPSSSSAGGSSASAGGDRGGGLGRASAERRSVAGDRRGGGTGGGRRRAQRRQPLEPRAQLHELACARLAGAHAPEQPLEVGHAAQATPQRVAGGGGARVLHERGDLV